ncbi:acid protease [Aspergillus homomorphus CBS 101889]|uniref:Acid protease n=1 Tax=Aspergillus homomorphus (strain CBS 101889) TaxID=1450537 RepID=A0A395I0R2_ASPHC|nr:acid protease [Aspergillus homomorphus CBS 101889]RAL13386.1 acid protease [Aspergillus homomorphus CBS 101889]
MRFTASSLAAATLLAGVVSAAPAPARQGVSKRVFKPAPLDTRANSKASSSVLELKKVKNQNGATSHSAARLKKGSSSSTTSGSSTLISLIEGEEFATSITVGSDSFDVIVDTGSSDLWLVEKGFTCLDENSKQVSESECVFGPAWSPTSSFSKISGEEFSISYGDGEFATGVMGKDEVTLAGISVEQELAAVTKAYWTGDGTTSGLVGLAYPGITSAYSTRTEQQVEYDPIITTLIDEGLIDSYFSLAIERDVSGAAGYITLGGLPPVNYTDEWTSTDILVTTSDGKSEGYAYYTIDIDAVTLNGKSLTSAGGSSIQYIVDSGTTLNYYPTSIAAEVNAAFTPAATYSEEQGAYVVDCNATAPAHGVTISGTTYIINPLDMILDAGTDASGNTVCISGVVDGGSDYSKDIFILGDVFLKNVVAVFDVGAVKLKFAPREFYDSNDVY